MPRLKKKEKKVTKGMPSAVVLSILIHAALFLLAGMLVVFTVVKKEEQKFEPPKAIDRPKMKLRKPKVKIKKTSKPKPTTRIVTKMSRADMPDIQLPEMSGLSSGLEGGIGGFDMMPDLDQVTVFGSGQSVGNDLVGTFYDLKRDRQGRALVAGMDKDKYKHELMKFLRSGWKISTFSRYYRSPKQLYATTIMVPAILSSEAPTAFDEPDTDGWFWMVLYKGQLVYKEDITFRFWGLGDNELFVRLNGELVLVACWKNSSGTGSDAYFSPLWSTPDLANSRKYYLGNNKSVVGDWITLKAGEPVDMEVLIGELGGGSYCSMLLVEVKGEKYPKNRQGGPILPIFKMAYPSLDLQDAIYKDHVPDEASVTNGPVFSDYDTKARVESDQRETTPPSTNPVPEVADDGMRLWTGVNGKSLEAQFVITISDKVVLKDAQGRQKKIPVDQLSEEDRIFVELAQPPEFKIDFSPKTSTWRFNDSPWFNNPRISPTMYDYMFAAKLKQTSTGNYNHKLNVEFFAIGKEHMGDKFILLARQSSEFVPAVQKDRFFTFSTDKKVTIYTTDLYGDVRGTDYYGYLIVVTDQRGKIIQHSKSNKWLFSARENLRKLPVGRYMDKTGKRVFPTSPRPTKY